MGKVNWHPERFRRPFDSMLARRADRAGQMVAARARLLAGRPGTPRLRSLPGEPPRRQTGRLILSITSQLRSAWWGIWSVVGSPLDYAGYLSRGTKRMAPRPFLDRALNELRLMLRRYLIRGN